LILIAIGLFGLWIGTKWVINGALGLAKLLHLSHSFVGLAILGVGTDLPEVFVTLKAAILHLKGIESSGIITGNAIGSSISQITIILGIAGLLLKFSMTKEDLFRNGVFLLSSTLLLFMFGFDGVINRIEGTILVITYASYYWLLLRTSDTKEDEYPSDKSVSKLTIILYLLLGLLVLIYSSHLVVNNAMLLATKWNVEQSFVGIVIIGLGTSLPELAVSIGAAIRKSAEMSVGNIIGSNIFDGLIPIGLGGLISTTSMENHLLKFDLPILFGVSLLVVLFLRTKRGISKPEGIALIAIYLIYILLKINMF